MPGAIARVWEQNRHGVGAAMFTAATLVVLLWFVNTRPTQVRSGGSSSVAPFAAPALQQHVRERVANSGAKIGGVVGGIPGGTAGVLQQSVSDGPRVVRTAALRMLTDRPSDTVEKLTDLALLYGGTVQNSSVSGTERSQTAQVTLQVAADRFDEARRDVRRLTSSLEQETTDARDVTRTLTDQDARLRNLHAEEAQYLGILKRADKVKDIVAVTEKLSEVRGEIERLDAERRYLGRQVEMAVIVVSIGTAAEAEVLGLHWRPVYKARLAVLSALSGFTDYADAMFQLIVHLPLIAVWAATVLLFARIAWALLRRVMLLVFRPKAQESVGQA